MSDKPKQARGAAVRDTLVGIAADLFYADGVRAVGVDEVVRRSGMAKASLYRWFPSKDDLVLAVLQRRDENFWAAWDSAAESAPDPRAELDAQLTWIQRLATHPDYRGCAFVNTAAEFGDGASAAVRQRCLDHEQELRRRLRALAERLAVEDSARFADLMHLGIVGAFATGGIYESGGPADQLRTLAASLLGEAPPPVPTT
ncbi:TetR/AcrR family transcriptional regulator [Nocardia sp. AG03]|uniref:TetR/AcrR family transcriptional regulator n=1 Tax=Nocardia sp. AG03 TaxID=3025312 RepID=UPI0024186C90|nr:TetR/AcrR family transcriptional regulator [Nocardia sp. AG03]